MKHKLDILKRLKERGIWLQLHDDGSLEGVKHFKNVKEDESVQGVFHFTAIGLDDLQEIEMENTLIPAFSIFQPVIDAYIVNQKRVPHRNMSHSVWVIPYWLHGLHILFRHHGYEAVEGVAAYCYVVFRCHYQV